jgi:Flp pilus assembly protein TadG
MRSRSTLGLPRRGATAVEAAFVLPVAFMFIIGMVVIGLGIYRYQQVAALAREGARYASVHGTKYAAIAGNTAATQASILSNAIVPMAVGLNTSSSYLTCTVTWNTSNSPTSYNPNSNPPGEPLQNTVSVTVTYKWVPEMYIAGPINLTSTSTMPMTF